MRSGWEIGGYIEWEHYHRPLLHEDGILLNSGRSCLAYLMEARKIQKIRLPYFLCDSVRKLCEKYSVEYEFYSIEKNFHPAENSLADFKCDEEWLYIVNYYGQLGREAIHALKKRYETIIIDNAQAYFEEPLPGIDTLYTCRKFFGVADGGILYTEAEQKQKLPQDESFRRMNFLLGRFERTASEFYGEYVENNRIFEAEPVKKMSALTENLLRSIDYDGVRAVRRKNFETLHGLLKGRNQLALTVPDGAFMYPFYIRGGGEVRARLQRKKIYIPKLWPDVFQVSGEDALEADMAENILPLPVDQRYGEQEMEYMAEEIRKCMD